MVVEIRKKKRGFDKNIIKAKYLQDEGISIVKHILSDSSIWTDLAQEMGNNSLLEIYMVIWQTHCVIVIFDLCSDKDIIVFQFLTNGQVHFNRWLPPILFEHWLDIVDNAYKFRYQNEEDTISWRWGAKGTYTTKSVYDHLTMDDLGISFQHIWKSKISYKVKIHLAAWKQCRTHKR